MMPQQEMNYGEMGRERPGFTYGHYEGMPFTGFQEEKLSGRARSQAPTAGQRLALAMTSLAMFMLLTFGLITIAAAQQAPPWVVLPILFVLFLYSTIAIIVNIAFNAKA